MKERQWWKKCEKKKNKSNFHVSACFFTAIHLLQSMCLCAFMCFVCLWKERGWERDIHILICREGDGTETEKTKQWASPFLIGYKKNVIFLLKNFSVSATHTPITDIFHAVCLCSRHEILNHSSLVFCFKYSDMYTHTHIQTYFSLLFLFFLPPFVILILISYPSRLL